MNKKDFGHIGVLMGGYSSEREISLKSGHAVLGALNRSGCRVTGIDIQVKDPEKISDLIKEKNIDVAFVALHGCLGEDGIIQGILEGLGLPYTGSGVEASQLALDKISTQRIFEENDVPVPVYTVASRSTGWTAHQLPEGLQEFPLIVKPASEGSSMGITIVHKSEDLPAALNKAWEFQDEVLVEKYIQGRELTVGILGQQPLPIVEIRSKNAFFDFTAKYQKGITEYIVPAQVPDPLSKTIQQKALRGYQALGCCDLSRVDLIVDDQDRLYFLEINTIPGFTATSLLPMAANAVGINFPELCLKLVGFAYAKKK